MASLSEKQKMLAGDLYNGFDPELLRERGKARRLVALYNATTLEEPARRAELLKELLGAVGEGAWIEPPFFCDYGSNIHVGKGVFLNFNCVVLDCHEVHIGEGTLIAPAVQIYTAYHPTDPVVRKTGRELAAPVRLGQNVWVGGGAIICPGVTIGDNTTIGAGSVVLKDVPANVIAGGNPCRVIRPLAAPPE